MTALVGRVVVIDHVAFVDVISEEAGDAFHRRYQRAQVDGNVLPLQDHLRKVVEEGVGIVVSQVENARTASFFQRQGHFALRGFKRAPHDCQGDRIYCTHGSPQILFLCRWGS
ncbi:hypothetical protein D3C80_1819940 [compost metagenome]